MLNKDEDQEEEGRRGGGGAAAAEISVGAVAELHLELSKTKLLFQCDES